MIRLMFLLELGAEWLQINKQCKEYCLVAYDWSHIDYKRHKSKKDCIEERRSKTTTAKSIGYDLQGSLAISDKDGTPITPLLQNLKTSNKVSALYIYIIIIG